MPPLSPVESERLRALHDIVLPASPGGWPVAPGWWLVAVLLGLLAVRVLQALWRRWQGDAWRRRALRQLRVLHADATLDAQTRLTSALRVRHAAARHRPTPASDDLRFRDAPYWPPARVSSADALHVIEATERWLRQKPAQP